MQDSRHAARQSRGSGSWLLSTAFVFVVMFGALRGRALLLIPALLLLMVIVSKLAHAFRTRRRAEVPTPHPISYEQRAQVMRELGAGNTFQAVRLYRSFTGADLYTARRTIETWRRGLPG